MQYRTLASFLPYGLMFLGAAVRSDEPQTSDYVALGDARWKRHLYPSTQVIPSSHVQPFFPSAQFSILLILSGVELHIWNPRSCVELPILFPASTIQMLVYVDLSFFCSLCPCSPFIKHASPAFVLDQKIYISISILKWYLHRLDKHNNSIRQYVLFSEKEYSILLY